MGIFLDEPKFPVIERNPTASSTISNFSFSDYVRITAITGASLPVGFLAELTGEVALGLREPNGLKNNHIFLKSVMISYAIVPNVTVWRDADDYIRITAITVGSLPLGFLSGGSVNIRGPSMYTAGIIGLMGGFMYAYQCSAGRLMGMFPNEDEVARHKR